MPLAMPPAKFKQRMRWLKGSVSPKGNLGHWQGMQGPGQANFYLAGSGKLFCLWLLPWIQISSSWIIFFPSLQLLYCLDLPPKASNTETAIYYCRAQLCAPHWGESASWAVMLHPGADGRLLERQEPRVALPSALWPAVPCEWTSTAWSTKTGERCLQWGYFSLAAKALGKLPVSLLSLLCSPMPKALLPSGGTDETKMGQLTSPGH